MRIILVTKGKLVDLEDAASKKAASFILSKYVIKSSGIDTVLNISI